MSGENPRVCNQGILNYLLIKLRTDKNFVKFWKVLNLLVNQPELRAAIGNIMKGTYVCSIHVYVYYMYVCVIYVCIDIKNGLCPLKM